MKPPTEKNKDLKWGFNTGLRSTMKPENDEIPEPDYLKEAEVYQAGIDQL